MKENLELDRHEKSIFKVLLQYMDSETHICTLTFFELMDKSGCSRAMVQRKIESLISKGYISKIQRRPHPNVYTVLLVPDVVSSEEGALVVTSGDEEEVLGEAAPVVMSSDEDVCVEVVVDDEKEERVDLMDTGFKKGKILVADHFPVLRKLIPELKALVETGDIKFDVATAVWAEASKDVQRKVLESVGVNRVGKLAVSKVRSLVKEFGKERKILSGVVEPKVNDVDEDAVLGSVDLVEDDQIVEVEMLIVESEDEGVPIMQEVVDVVDKDEDHDAVMSDLDVLLLKKAVKEEKLKELGLLIQGIDLEIEECLRMEKEKEDLEKLRLVAGFSMEELKNLLEKNDVKRGVVHV